MSMLDTQVGGSHYKTMKIQPLEYCHANNIGKIEGDVIAYVSRWRSKGGIEDLQKAVHELEILIELEQAANSVQVAAENLAKKVSRIDQQARDLAHVEQDYAPEFSPTSDGWFLWKGGEMPIPEGTPIKRILRDGDVATCRAGDDHADRWCHLGVRHDIVGYRIIQSEPEYRHDIGGAEA